MLWREMGLLQYVAGLVIFFWFCGSYAADEAMQALFRPLHMSITHANRALQKASTHRKTACDLITVLRNYEQSFETDVDEILRQLADKQNEKLQSLIHSEQMDDLVRGVNIRLLLLYAECYKKDRAIAKKDGLVGRVSYENLPMDEICPEEARLCRSFWVLRGSIAQFSKYIELKACRTMQLALFLWHDMLAMKTFGGHFGVSSSLSDAQRYFPNDLLDCISRYLLPGSTLSRSGIATLWRELQERKSERPNLLDAYKSHCGKAANRDIVALFYALGFKNNQTVSR